MAKFQVAVFLIVFFFSIGFKTVMPLSAGPFSWSTHGNILFFAANNGRQGSDPAPILPSLGYSITYQPLRHLRIEFTQDIYFTNYEYNRFRIGRGDDESYIRFPMAANPENRAAFVMGFITGIQATGIFPIGENGTAFRIFGGPAADLRIVALAFGLNHPADFTGELDTDVQMQTDAIRRHFWSEGRWFYPVAGIGMDFPINERFLLGFNLRTWFPVFRLWTDEDQPALNSWRFGAGIRISPRQS